MIRKLTLIFFLSIICIVANASPNEALLKNSKQYILVTAKWHHAEGKLQRYQRPTLSDKWMKVGNEIPVVIGKNGLAIKKQEGDHRTPIGVFPIGPAFGFERHPNFIKIPYFPLDETSICVDDPKSKFYNRLLNSASVPHPDWQSGEKMRQISLYRLGSVIQYNISPTLPGAGSCIFMHIWRNAHQGTAGCIAMQADALQNILQWLDEKDKPMIVITPK